MNYLGRRQEYKMILFLSLNILYLLIPRKIGLKRQVDDNFDCSESRQTVLTVPFSRPKYHCALSIQCSHLLFASPAATPIYSYHAGLVPWHNLPDCAISSIPKKQVTVLVGSGSNESTVGAKHCPGRAV